jgi:hypothetical protein
VNRDQLAGIAAKKVLGLVGPEDLLGAADAALGEGLDCRADLQRQYDCLSTGLIYQLGAVLCTTVG